MKTVEATIPQLRMLASFRGQQWMIREDQVMSFALSSLEASERVNGKHEDSWLAEFYPMRQPLKIDGYRVAHIEVKGALMYECPSFYEKIGLATRYKTIISEMRSALNQGAKGILFHVCSPGGTVSGNIEAAEFILSSPVPTVAHCDGIACSAAYKLAAGTGQIIASKSAEIGNIGTILAWADCEEFWSQMGIEWKALVSEGADLKSTFHTEPNETQIAFLQDSVNDAGATFRNHVKAGREKAGAELDPEIWRAGWYDGEVAVDLGLSDDIGDADFALETLRDMMQ